MNDSERVRRYGPKQAEKMKWFADRYEVIAQGLLLPDADRVYLGEKAHRVCRYCGHCPPDVNFANVAHAFPEQIGNNTLIDNLECDSCNRHFANLVEDDFAKWTMPFRTLGRVIGKSGIPTHKTSDDQLRIEATNPYNLRVTAAANDARYSVDHTSHTIKFQMARQPHVPMGVFKCLVKMAMAVLPADETEDVSHLKQWILERTHTFESYQYKPLNVISQAIPGPLPHAQIGFCLFRRRPDCDSAPYMIFVLQFSNYIFQITLPMHAEDAALLNGAPFAVGLFPHIWGTAAFEDAYGCSGHRVDDLSSTCKVADNAVTIFYSYDGEERVDISQ
jgi:hypothetical protein